MQHITLLQVFHRPSSLDPYALACYAAYTMVAC